MADYWYDCWYHVKTCGIVRLKNSRIINFDYEPTHYFELQKIFTQLPFSKDSHLIDYGCGKGRVLLMAALYGCPRVTGIDLNSDLCRIAESNIARLRTHKGINTDIQVMEQDAIQYKIDPSYSAHIFETPEIDDMASGKNALFYLADNNGESALLGLHLFARCSCQCQR